MLTFPLGHKKFLQLTHVNSTNDLTANLFMHTNLTLLIAVSVSMSPSVHTEMDTLLFFIANSWRRDPKNPFKALFVETYGAVKGLGILPVKHQQLEFSGVFKLNMSRLSSANRFLELLLVAPLCGSITKESPQRVAPHAWLGSFFFLYTGSPQGMCQENWMVHYRTLGKNTYDG